ncbi:MAG: hypothetical protein WKG06_23845 [Segetibacter sp.]
MKTRITLIVVSVLIFSCGQNDTNEKTSSVSESEAIDKLITNTRQYPDSAGLRMRLINLYDSLENV